MEKQAADTLRRYIAGLITKKELRDMLNTTGCRAELLQNGKIRIDETRTGLVYLFPLN